MHGVKLLPPPLVLRYERSSESVHVRIAQTRYERIAPVGVTYFGKIRATALLIGSSVMLSPF
jgi:hypothetical protein